MEETQRNLRRRRGTLLDLPYDIVEKILSLLSVKSLSRLKCVSKSLCSLISSESFVKVHLFKSSKDARLKIVTGQPFHNPLYYSGSRSLKQRRVEFNTVRSCNGLVCDFSISGKDFTLRNPSTRKCKKLPPVDFEKEIDGLATCCGFGYVESSDDYKVCALSLQRKIDGLYHSRVKVYSLKMDCWRIVVDNYKLKTPMGYMARYLCGMLYWLRIFRNKKKRLCWEIISFDLDKEVFETTVEQPGELKGLSSYIPLLGVFNGSLCVLCISRVTDIWVLKQDTLPPSWTKIAVLPERRRSLSIVELDIFDRACVHVESLVSLDESEEAGVHGHIIDLENGESELRRLL